MLLLVLTDETPDTPLAGVSSDLRFNPRCYPFSVVTDETRAATGGGAVRGASGYSFSEQRYRRAQRVIRLSFAAADYANAFSILRSFESTLSVLPMVFDHPDDSNTLNVVFVSGTLQLTRTSSASWSVTLALEEVL